MLNKKTGTCRMCHISLQEVQCTHPEHPVSVQNDEIFIYSEKTLSKLYNCNRAPDKFDITCVPLCRPNLNAYSPNSNTFLVTLSL